MSHQNLADALEIGERPYKERVMQDTWGCLAPKRNRTYRGYIVFCISETGDIVPIRSDFGNLPGSPWFHDVLNNFVYENAKEEGKIYRFDGTFRNYKFNGKVKLLDV